MAKKELKSSKKAEEAEERDASDEGEAEEGGASSRLSAAQQRRARRRERIDAAPAHDSSHDDHDHDHGHDHGHDRDHHDDEDEVDTSNDPTWWVPHTVLGALVVVGILGFFGAFNSLAARLGYKGAPNLAAAHEAHATSKPEAPRPPEPPKPTQPGPQQQQPPREMFGAKHLLVMYKGSQRAPENVTRTKDEAKARAEEARKKAKAGAKFEDLVKEYSDEPGAGARGGDLGKFPKGRMVGPFQEGLEKTKVNEISDIVETPFGFHVILRTQ